MKYSINTYRLYNDEKRFSSVIRARVTMKEPVDIDILRRSVNTAIKRYPYFAVHVTVDKDGGYVLLPNHKEVAVLPVTGKCPKLATKKVNGHLVSEVSSMGDKIFLSFMRLFQESKYVSALKDVLDELGIAYKVEGPFPKHLSKHVLP